MDRDIRSSVPGKCSRCGMALVAGIPEPVEYRLDVHVAPEPPRPAERARLTFEVFDPWENNPVRKFSVVHERLFHAFLISRDLEVFVHYHPVRQDDVFVYDFAFPKSGMYRIVGDFYPEGATPQLIAKTIFVAGPDHASPRLARDYAPKTSENLRVEMATTPNEVMAGSPVQMQFKLTPEDGLEKYLGVWAHMLIASDDLIDTMHTHPFIPDGSREMLFSLIFPRPHVYRVWVQFQRQSVVNTVHFDVPVKPAVSSKAAAH